MERRPSGPVPREVAVIGQGTWDIDDAHRPTAVADLRRSLDLGMTHLDTAETYVDALDLGTLASTRRRRNPKRSNAAVAPALVVGLTLLDLLAYAGVEAAHRRGSGSERDYPDRSGPPRGTQASRGLARRDLDPPPDYRAAGTVADALPELVA
jgi:hypothetical protein